MHPLVEHAPQFLAELGPRLILYDGVCGLCNRQVQAVLRRDRQGRFQFAPLQGRLAREILLRNKRDPGDLDSVCLVHDPGKPTERMFVRSRAVLQAMSELTPGARVLALARFMPPWMLDWAYSLIAKKRYKWFGRLGACPVPSPDQRHRFVGMEGEGESAPKKSE